MAGNRAQRTQGEYDFASAITTFEAGQLDDAGTVKLFQFLIDSGLAWQLQGAYGRQASFFLEQGVCVWPHEMRH